MIYNIGNNKHSKTMKDLTRILHDLNQGNINSDEAEMRVLGLFNVVGSKPTAFEKNNLPLQIRYAFCEAIEMYHNIQAYEMGLVNKTDFINHTISIKDKYK
jgi:hypothetical protein